MSIHEINSEVIVDQYDTLSIYYLYKVLRKYVGTYLLRDIC